MIFLKLYGLAFVLFLSVDLLWLGFLAKNFYRNQIGFLMLDKIKWAPALLFYCLYIAGLVVFTIYPYLKEANWKMPLLYGAFFGLICYATYDLTNLATLKGWPLKLVIADLIWGACLSALISWATYSLALYWKFKRL
ncbi:MAG: DUF2177 family protein [Chlamydiota bacterium]